MRRSKEIMILFALLVGAMVFVLAYVIHRRAKNRAAPPVATRMLAPEPPAAPAPTTEPVPLGGANERKTIDFSSGQPVVKNTPEDQVAVDAAVKEMADAAKDVTFEPAPKKPAEPAKK